jgi:RNA polymerase sigma-70 factor, ECF subfamily
MTAFAVTSPIPNYPPRAQTRAGFHRLLSVTDLKGLRRLALQLGRGVVDPDDLLQDALERACRHHDSFQLGTNLNAWLRTIMQRLVIDQWRKRARQRAIPPVEMISPEPGEREVEPTWSRYGLDEVRRAAAQLREPVRSTFLLHLEQRLCYAAISERLGVPPSTVGTRLRRARTYLRDILETMPAAPALDRSPKSRDEPRSTSDRASDSWCPPPSPQPRRQRQEPAPTTAKARSPRPSRAATGARCSLG